MASIIHTDKAPNAIGPYAQARILGNLIFTSGQIGLCPVTFKLVDGFDAQARMILDNLSEILHAASSNLSMVMRLNVYLTNMDHYAALNNIMYARFNEPYPARTTIVVSQLPANALVEMDVIATRNTVLTDDDE